MGCFCSCFKFLPDEVKDGKASATSPQVSAERRSIRTRQSTSDEAGVDPYVYLPEDGEPDTGGDPADVVVKTGVHKFNLKPTKGLAFLFNKGALERTPEAVATFLYKTKGLSKRKIGNYLGEHGDFEKSVLNAFIDQMNFAEMDFDVALRTFLSCFRMPGESQIIDRIMERFSQRYCQCNPSTFASPDTAYVLAFSVIMLNTDAHNPNVKNKMTKKNFINLNKSASGKKVLADEYLSQVYDSILSNEIKMNASDSRHGEVATFIAPEMEGWLIKQSENAIQSSKRRWFTLTGNCLYYFKSPEDSTPRCIIPLENVVVRKTDEKGVFEICSQEEAWGRKGEVLKAAKILDDGNIVPQTNHRRYVLRGENDEEALRWVSACKKETSRNPYYSLIQRKKGVIDHERRASSLSGNGLLKAHGRQPSVFMSNSSVSTQSSVTD